MFGRVAAPPPPLPPLPPPAEAIKLDYFVYNSQTYFRNVGRGEIPDPTIRPVKGSVTFDIFKKLSFS